MFLLFLLFFLPVPLTVTITRSPLVVLFPFFLPVPHLVFFLLLPSFRFVCSIRVFYYFWLCRLPPLRRSPSSLASLSLAQASLRYKTSALVIHSFMFRVFCVYHYVCTTESQHTCVLRGFRTCFKLVNPVSTALYSCLFLFCSEAYLICATDVLRIFCTIFLCADHQSLSTDHIIVLYWNWMGGEMLIFFQA